MATIDQYSRWEKQVRAVSLPHWEDLPKFDLYMDQVVAYVNDALGPLGVDLLTPAMVNNYVKHKVLMAPIKKRYQTMQLADLIIIGLLKPMYQVETIRNGMDQITSGNFPKQAYDNFIDLLTKSLRTLGTPHEISQGASLEEKLAQVAVNSTISHLQATKLLKLVQKPLRTVDSK